MQLHEVPPSRHVSVVVEETELQVALAAIFNDKPIRFFDVIEGAPCSGRVLSTAPTKTSVETAQSTPLSIARAFLLLNSEARRIPSTKGSRAWEVRTATPYGGPPRAILWATWS